MDDMDTAIVLGGGGVTGIAWEWGILAGLAAAGIDLSNPDLVVGTSAGSVVGAQVAAGADVEERYAAQLKGPGAEVAAKLSAPAIARIAFTVLRSRDPQRARARIGHMALATNTVPEAERRAIIESRLPVKTWPDRRLKITAVEAATGDFVVFDKDSEVELVDAVAASCAVPGVWPPVTIDGRRYVDGGVRSAANIDLAAGYARVLVLAPITTGFGPMPSVARQVAELEKQSTVVVVSPDKTARRAFGRNMLDPARRAPAAEAGRTQAKAVAESVGAAFNT